eukprot:355359-Chlamydomonas_euryale.AAC.3
MGSKCGTAALGAAITCPAAHPAHAQVLDALRELAVGRTTVMVAHRLSTAAQCDNIVVLEDGRVVEQGSHAQLLASGGRYADLWAKQATVEDLM